MSLYDPRNRKEIYYRGILDGDNSLPDPQTREEIFLKAIAEAMPIITDATVKQTTGTSATDVMSQKAVTDLFDGLQGNLFGTTDTVTGSYYLKYVHNVNPDMQVLVTLVSSASSGYVQFSGLPDANDTGNSVYQFRLMNGQSILWTPTRDFEALYWGVAGASEVTFSYPGIYGDIQKVFHVGANSDYTTLKAGLEEATKYMDSILYVHSGTYDLISEFGNDYFNNLSSIDTMAGLQLKNRVHVIFSSNSKVVCHYTGANTYVRTLFSPFNCYENGFTIENLTLECSNVRYAIHDERNGAVERCQHIYKNCNIKIDNTNNTDWHKSTCIGGGLGSDSYVVIDGCVFNAVEISGNPYSVGVYYHQSNNNNVSNHKANILIKNNYFVDGLIALQLSRTDASEDTIFKITNNNIKSFASADSEGVYIDSSATHVQIYEWNNIKRT